MRKFSKKNLPHVTPLSTHTHTHIYTCDLIRLARKENWNCRTKQEFSSFFTKIFLNMHVTFATSGRIFKEIYFSQYIELWKICNDTTVK